MVYKGKNRYYHLDLLKALACFAVIMIHASAPFVSRGFGTFSYWTGHIFDSLCRFGVPIFIMVSGALLLDENYDYSFKKILKKIIWLLVFYLTWSFAYALMYEIVVPLIKGIAIDWKATFTTFFNGHLHLWFIPMIIGLYLLVPVFRLFVKKENKKLIGYVIIVSLIISCLIPLVFKIIKTFNVSLLKADSFFNNLNSSIPICYIPLFLLGWYLNNFKLSIIERVAVYILGGFGLLFTLFCSFVISLLANKLVFFYSSTDYNVILYSISIFLLITQLFANRCNKLYPIRWMIISISNLSLGIYGMHVGFGYFMSRVLERNLTINPLVVIPLVFVFSFTVSWLISFVTSKIPVIKHLVS